MWTWASCAFVVLCRVWYTVPLTTGLAVPCRYFPIPLVLVTITMTRIINYDRFLPAAVCRHYFQSGSRSLSRTASAATASLSDDDSGMLDALPLSLSPSRSPPRSRSRSPVSRMPISRLLSQLHFGDTLGTVGDDAIAVSTSLFHRVSVVRSPIADARGGFTSDSAATGLLKEHRTIALDVLRLLLCAHPADPMLTLDVSAVLHPAVASAIVSSRADGGGGASARATGVPVSPFAAPPQPLVTHTDAVVAAAVAAVSGRVVGGDVPPGLSSAGPVGRSQRPLSVSAALTLKVPVGNHRPGAFRDVSLATWAIPLPSLSVSPMNDGFKDGEDGGTVKVSLGGVFDDAAQQHIAEHLHIRQLPQQLHQHRVDAHDTGDGRGPLHHPYHHHHHHHSDPVHPYDHDGLWHAQHADERRDGHSDQHLAAEDVVDSAGVPVHYRSPPQEGNRPVTPSESPPVQKPRTWSHFVLCVVQEL